MNAFSDVLGDAPAVAVAAARADPRQGRLRGQQAQQALHRQVGQAIADYNMIEAGDKVMVCLSAARTAMRCWTC